LTGCAKNNSNTNNAETNNNTNQVVNVANTSNTNGTNNTNLNNSDENVNNATDTSDWQIFSNQDMGFSFEYPLLSPETEFNYINCHGQAECENSTTGKSYQWSFKSNDNYHYFIAGSSTSGYAAGRSLEIRDEIRFDQKDNDYFIILANNNSFKVNPLKIIDTSLGKAIIYDIKDFPSYSELPSEFQKDKIAIYNLNNAINNFNSVSFYIYSSMSDTDINKIINSVKEL